MIIFWFTLFLCIFGIFGSDIQGIGKHSRTFDYRDVRLSPKIIHGNKTSVAKYPFIASLQLSQREYGAALILNKRWLLTIGFNVFWSRPEDLQFRVGSNSYASKGQLLKASQIIVHPNYTGFSWDYDIAVVKTKTPIKFNKKVKPIILGSKDLKDGIKAYVAGWGMNDTEYSPSDVLLEAEVTVVGWKKCAQVYKSDLTHQLMCTFDETAGPCVYDYGDPLIVENVLYGLYAGGYDCQPGAYPVLYADIPSLAPWVKSVITSDEEDRYQTPNIE